MTKHTGLTKAQYAAALEREQAARRAKTGDILAETLRVVGTTTRPPDAARRSGLTRVRAAAKGASSPTSARMKIMQWVEAGRLVAVPHCWDADLARYVTAYRAPEVVVQKPPAMMHCPKCKAHVPRVPPVCPNCGADTRRKRKAL